MINTTEAVQPSEPAAKFVNSGPIRLLIWVVITLLLVLPFWCSYLAIVDYHNRTVPEISQLESLSFKIISASERTPNFKVAFKDGTHAYLSFPDFLTGNGKTGLDFTQVSRLDRKNLVGCEASAKVNYVSWWIFNKRQIWDLTCPTANIHYGPQVAGSKVAESPGTDLIFKLVIDGIIFVIGWHRIIGYFIKRFMNITNDRSAR